MSDWLEYSTSRRGNPTSTKVTIESMIEAFARAEKSVLPNVLIMHPRTRRSLDFAFERFKGWPNFVLFPKLWNIQCWVHRKRTTFRWWREDRREMKGQTHGV